MGKISTLLRNIVELVGSRLPTRSRAGLVQRLVARANAERDTQRYLTASAFYEEALRLSPSNARVHIQCGHMYKEAGDFARAEVHYNRALFLLPDDPDLSLQLGHFYKLAERPTEAADAYRRAAAQRPGWVEAEEELKRISQADFWRVLGESPVEGVVPELLPAGRLTAPQQLREGLHVTRLGGTRLRSANGDRRALRGVEAVRGFVICSTLLKEVTLAVDGHIVAREPLHAHELARQSKYVFNIWHDFSTASLGEAQIELRVSDGRGWSRTHRVVLEIALPRSDPLAAASDAIIPLPVPAEQLLEDAINARPSVVRTAARAIFMEPPKTILVQRADQLGDLACSVPALARLRSHFPKAQIVALLAQSNADLGRTLPMIDEVIVAPFIEDVADGPRTMTASAQMELRRTLSRYCFDIALDLAETSGSRPLLLLSGARFLYGFKAREFPWMTAGFELGARDPGNDHEMAATAQKLVALVDSLSTLVGNNSEPAPRALPATLLAPFGIDGTTRFVVLHSGARLAYSRWPGFRALVKILVERTDLTVVTMGEDIADLPDHERLKRISGLLPFDAFDALLGNAMAFVGNDSGPKHLAALRGIPVVSLHMARLNWSEWGQTGIGSIISRQVPCAGCGIGPREEECGKAFACIRAIQPEEVFKALLDLLPAQQAN
ncbi:glycosyltransferase family 9 protein [Sphingomonas sp. BIUV-7]|uniref:Glycosyltransferase family 9 protein n=1 Tax=Sphingomonas natans TaxID=3063330 RepID=A0ABT8Y5Q5_9SPHN|nr:glycosyltransferase family 9 protein [Sphingomonas sp. BIUV-7]MDO6413657.1 glycosyltransferase family 9 protein [Sphingomonas sp. BIUV-7]